MSKIIDYFKGFSPKDTLSNIGGVLGLAGSLMLVNVQSGTLSAKYEKQAQGLIGTSIVLVAFATGKSADLKSGQSDKLQ